MGPQATLCVKIAGPASTLGQLLRPASHVQLENTLSTLRQLRNPSLAQLAEQGVSQALPLSRALLVQKESTSQTLRLATSPPHALAVPLASTARPRLRRAKPPVQPAPKVPTLTLKAQYPVIHAPLAASTPTKPPLPTFMTPSPPAPSALPVNTILTRPPTLTSTSHA